MSPPDASAVREEPSPVVVSSGPAAGWPDLSRRIARRTTDLIAISLIVVAGLTAARRILLWWKTDADASRWDQQTLLASDALAPWGTGPDGAVVGLGEQPFSLRQQTFQGSQSAAIEQLHEICRQVLGSPSHQFSELPAVTASESQLLSRLRDQSHAELSEDRSWSVHDLPGPIPMVIGVRRGDVPGADDRVLCWGMALARDSELWTLLHVLPHKSGTGGTDSSRLPVPAGCRTGLSLADERGGRLVTWSGAGPPGEWRTHFDSIAAQRGWSPLVAWRCGSDAWSAAWSIPAQPRMQRLDIQFTRSGAGWTGLANIAPTRQKEAP